MDGDILLPQAAARIAEDAAELDGKVRVYAPNEPLPTAANRAAAASAGLTALQEVLQGFPKGVQDEVAKLLHAEAQSGLSRMPADGDEIARTNVPPPPFRGSEPSAQSVALPSLAPDDAPATMAHRLIENTDAALARQTLLQAASLPVDTPGLRNDPAVPRWNFEIPFATPQGTAVAQFEISRDGAGNETEAASWSGARVFASMSSRAGLSMRWCRSATGEHRCGCGPSGPRPLRNCASMPRNCPMRCAKLRLSPVTS
jgi:hypothetical protein